MPLVVRKAIVRSDVNGFQAAQLMRNLMNMNNGGYIADIISQAPWGTSFEVFSPEGNPVDLATVYGFNGVVRVCVTEAVDLARVKLAT